MIIKLEDNMPFICCDEAENGVQFTVRQIIS